MPVLLNRRLHLYDCQNPIYKLRKHCGPAVVPTRHSTCRACLKLRTPLIACSSCQNFSLLFELLVHRVQDAVSLPRSSNRSRCTGVFDESTHEQNLQCTRWILTGLIDYSNRTALAPFKTTRHMALEVYQHCPPIPHSIGTPHLLRR